MKKGMIFSFMLGVILSGAVYAAATIASSKVSYDNKTSKSSSTNVQGAIDELYSNSLTGKNNIISALINKGFNVNNNATYNDIVNGINEMPITLTKDEEGNFGYVGDDGGFSSFNSGGTVKEIFVNCGSGLLVTIDENFTPTSILKSPNSGTTNGQYLKMIWYIREGGGSSNDGGWNIYALKDGKYWKSASSSSTQTPGIYEFKAGELIGSYYAGWGQYTVIALG